VKFGVDDRDGNGGGCFGIRVKLENIIIYSRIWRETRSDQRRFSVHQGC